MSAGLVIDIGGSCLTQPTLPGAAANYSPSGQLCGLSGVQVGLSVDMLQADTFCNIVVQGLAALTSGPLIIGIQTNDVDTSGTYTDPTSGLAQLPTYFSSGGQLILNSGSTGWLYASGISGTALLSGFMAAAAFQCPSRYARATFNSGFFIGDVSVGFIRQLRTTGSGGGFTMSPTSGGVNV